MDLTFYWWPSKTRSTDTGDMRTLMAWTGAAALSVLLGVILYSTSLQGSQAGYQETLPLASATPSAAPTIRQPESGMARELEQPAAPQVAVPPAADPVVAPTPVYTPPTSTKAAASSRDDDSSKEDESEREKHDD